MLVFSTVKFRIYRKLIKFIKIYIMNKVKNI